MGVESEAWGGEWLVGMESGLWGWRVWLVGGEDVACGGGGVACGEGVSYAGLPHCYPVTCDDVIVYMTIGIDL